MHQSQPISITREMSQKPLSWKLFSKMVTLHPEPREKSYFWREKVWGMEGQIVYPFSQKTTGETVGIPQAP